MLNAACAIVMLLMASATTEQRETVQEPEFNLMVILGFKADALPKVVVSGLTCHIGVPGSDKLIEVVLESDGRISAGVRQEGNGSAKVYVSVDTGKVAPAVRIRNKTGMQLSSWAFCDGSRELVETDRLEFKVVGGPGSVMHFFD
jgi:hypothetical protein